MPVVVAVADGSQTLLAVLVVLAVAAPAVDSMELTEEMVLLEPMLLVVVAAVAQLAIPQQVLVDPE